MATARKLEEMIHQLETLPPPLQEEVLDFINYLKMKQVKHLSENEDWSQFSLESALKGMENDSFPLYQPSDLKETWK